MSCIQDRPVHPTCIPVASRPYTCLPSQLPAPPSSWEVVHFDRELLQLVDAAVQSLEEGEEAHRLGRGLGGEWRRKNMGVNKPLMNVLKLVH